MDLEKVLDGMKAYLVANLNTYLTQGDTVELDLGSIAAKNIILFDLDPDKYKYNLTITIVPESDEFEATTVDGYAASSTISIYMIHRGDTRENLYKKTIRTTAALIKCFLADPTLDGIVGDMLLQGMDYYQAIEGNEDLKGAELRLQVLYEI